ncbi:hypothetical protein EDB80DRAFT_680162 [Ilyonectria destructans]|nr:hypothetical protein EDB80DRAFT_680162 [Ilyonectria destructans]
MAKESKGDTARRAAVGEDLARLIPDDGIPWYKNRHMLLLNFYAISLGLPCAANGYDGTYLFFSFSTNRDFTGMMNGLMVLPRWFDFMNDPAGAWLAFTNAVQLISSTLAYPIVSYFANRWGRKRGISVGYFFLALGAVLQAFTPNRTGFIISRLLMGQPSAWSGLAALLITELAYPTHRSFLTALEMFKVGLQVASRCRLTVDEVEGFDTRGGETCLTYTQFNTATGVQNRTPEACAALRRKAGLKLWDGHSASTACRQNTADNSFTNAFTMSQCYALDGRPSNGQL